MPNPVAVVFFACLVAVMVWYLKMAFEARRDRPMKTELGSYGVLLGTMAAGLIIGFMIIPPILKQVLSGRWLTTGDNAAAPYAIALISGPILGGLCGMWILGRRSESRRKP